MDKPTDTTKTETVTDPKVESMMRALGYLDSVNEQATLPADRENETTTEAVEETEASTDATTEVAETDATTTEGEVKTEAEKPAEDKGNATAEKKEPVKEEAKKDDVRVRKVAQKIPSLDEIEGVVREAVTNAQKKTEVEPKKEEDTFRKNLHPAELRALELAEAAEKIMPDRYKGQASKEAAWILSHREFVQKQVKENGGRFDPKSEEYVEFIQQNRPQIPTHDREEIMLTQAEERASKRAREEMSKEIASRDRAIAELKYAPVIEKFSNSIAEDLLTSVGDEQMANTFRSKPGELADEYPIEAPILAAGIADTVSAATEYLSLAKGLKQYSETNPTHEKLVKFIETQGRHLDDAAESGQPQVRDGKVIISRDKFTKLREAGKDLSRVTTLTDDDVVKMLTYAGKEGIKARIEAEKKRYETVRTVSERRAAKSVAASGDKKDAPAEIKTDVKAAASSPKGGATMSKGTKVNASANKSVPAHLKALGYENVTGSRD